MNTRDMYKNIYSSVFSHREIPPPTKKVRIANSRYNHPYTGMDKYGRLILMNEIVIGINLVNPYNKMLCRNHVFYSQFQKQN